MPKDDSNAFEYKKVRLREYPKQAEITLTVRGQSDPLKRQVTNIVENDKTRVRVKVDAAFRAKIMDAIDWMKDRELPDSSKNITQQIRCEHEQFEIRPYESAAQITEQYKIGDGDKCNYSFSSDAEFEDFFKQPWGVPSIRISPKLVLNLKTPCAKIWHFHR